MKINNKAQMETMGLLVIVILVSLILFFVLSFTLKNKPSTVDTKDFTKTQAVSNFGTTMLETTVKCKETPEDIRTIRALLTDCGFSHEISCEIKDETGNVVPADSCKAAKNEISKILNLTLNKWGYSYNLTVESGSIEVLAIGSLPDGCDKAKSSSREETPFGTEHGTMLVAIKICD
jgi:hypothetical protein